MGVYKRPLEDTTYTPLKVLRTQVQVSSQQQNDVQGRSTSPSHCCSICCSRGEVLMRGMCSRDARSGGDGEDGSYPHPRLHPRQLLPHPRLHRSSALLRGLSLQVLCRNAFWSRGALLR